MFNKEYFESTIYKNISNRLKESFIKENYFDFYIFIENNYIADTFLEKLYIFYNGRHLCYCGNNTKFINFKKGYLEYCSSVCSSKSKKTREKYKKTNIEKYGVDNPSKCTKTKNKKRDTFLEKYGVESYLQTEEVKNIIMKKYNVINVFQNKTIKEKIKQTNIEKYGVDSYTKTKEYLIKSRKTCLERYSVSHYSKTVEWANIMREMNYDKYIQSLNLSDDYIFISKEGYNNKFIHKSCGEEFEIQTQLLRLRLNEKRDICTKCNKIIYYSESNLKEFISKLYKDKITTYRDNKYEIDIYLPDIKLGFEYNGLYWHSELYKNNNYHQNKMLYFKEMGIRIINVWEDDWLYNNDIIKSVISSILNRNNEIIYARKCEIKLISNSECTKFLNENHLKGWCVCKYKYGLVYNDVLISVITFGKKRVNLSNKKYINEDSYELLRYANKINYRIIGGFSKLLKHFIKIHNPSELFTYCDASMFTGDVYQKNGFKLNALTNPVYYYIVNKLRKNRFNYTKYKLVMSGYDKNKTEKEIMFENKYYRIYNCGNYKYQYKII